MKNTETVEEKIKKLHDKLALLKTYVDEIDAGFSKLNGFTRVTIKEAIVQMKVVMEKEMHDILESLERKV